MTKLSFKYLLVLVLIYLLVVDVESWRRKKKKGKVRKWFKKAGKKIKNAFKKVGQKIKKHGCKWFYGIACPAAVGVAGAAITGSTGPVGGAAAAVGGAVVSRACRVQRKKCKNRGRREADNTMHEMLVPFSENLRDYDMNGDKCVSYEEFVFAVLRTIPLEHPSHLREPFDASDFDGDGILSSDEFKSAPLLFAHSANVTFAGFTEIIDDTLTTTGVPDISSTPEESPATTPSVYAMDKSSVGFPSPLGADYKVIATTMEVALNTESKTKLSPAA